MRVKIVRNHKQYKKGETIEVTRNEAHGLIDQGVAIISKDIVREDIKETSSGSTTRLRPLHRKRR